MRKGLNNNIIKIDKKSNIDKVIAVTEHDIIKEFPWLVDQYYELPTNL